MHMAKNVKVLPWCWTDHCYLTTYEQQIFCLSEKSEYGYSFGWAIAKYIQSGQEWPETLLFPRVSYCRVPSIRLVGGENAYTAQCALPINMLNEKLYIFLWFWIVFLVIVTAISLTLWIIRMISPFRRYRYIARFLRVCRVEDEAKQRVEPRGKMTQLQHFVDAHLRQDGVFLIRMLAINAGDVLAADVVGVMWKNYRECEVAEINSPATTPTSLEMPTAPLDKVRKIEVGFVWQDAIIRLLLSPLNVLIFLVLIT